jgi:uncharacterized membrane protein
MKTTKRILQWLLGIAFIAAGALHFLYAEFYLKIMPPFLPAPLFLVYVSGFFEVALGVLFLIPKYTRLAAYGLIGLLIAVFPANVYMAANPQLFPNTARLRFTLDCRCN